MIDTKNIKNLILDLGGVILELDVEATVLAFEALGFPRLENYDIILSKYPFFLEFETGRITREEFLAKVVKASGDHITEEAVLDAWNAMIRGFKKENVDRLLELRSKHRLFLLSNTNAIHEVLYNEQLKQEHGIENLDRIFEKVYYSHDLKMRKPDVEIFKYVLSDAGLQPGESLYVDDTLEHVESARSLGIHAHHLAPPQRLTEIL
jgi:putative hydrolase of the HAD superfamily